MKIKHTPRVSKPSIITSILVSTIIVGCGSDNNSDELAKAVDLETQRSQGTIIESVTILDDHVRLRAGESHQLSASGVDSNNDIRDITNELIWSSSDTTIATVSSNGLVSAVTSSSVNQGIVTITGTTINDIYNVGEVSVSDAAVTSINLKQIEPTTGSINTCIKGNITGNVNYDDGYTSLNTVKNISFSLDEKTSATIGSDGAIYTSSAEIEHSVVTGKINQVSGQLTVTADPKNLERIDILQNDKIAELITLSIGERVLVNGRASLMNQASVSEHMINETISWSQADTSYAGITNTTENKGTILALKPGVTQLIGTCGGKQATATLKVNGTADIDKLKINDGSETITLAPLASVELTLTASFSATTTSLNVSEFAKWSTNGSNLINAELINLGTDKASYKLTSTLNKAGTAIISVSYDDLISNVTVNIE